MPVALGGQQGQGQDFDGDSTKIILIAAVIRSAAGPFVAGNCNCFLLVSTITGIQIQDAPQ